MIARRGLLAGGLALMAPAALSGVARAAAGSGAGLGGLPVPPEGRLGFDVWLGSRKLGTHDLTFQAHGDELLVTVAVELAYRIGPITLYHYSHHATERWAGGQVTGLATQTNDNGTRHQLAARRQGAALLVEPVGAAAYVAPGDALPATHWNHRELDGPWINTQNGELVRPHVTPEGTGTVRMANGGALKARHYALSGPVQLDIWYDEALAWAGLSFVKGGSEVRYARRG